MTTTTTIENQPPNIKETPFIIESKKLLCKDCKRKIKYRSPGNNSVNQAKIDITKPRIARNPVISLYLVMFCIFSQQGPEGKVI
jgi:hypothetical protein